MTPFDWLKQITVEKRDWNSFTEEEQQGFNPFIINKALSFNKDYIQIVEMAMVYPMPPQKLYEFYRDVIPKKPIWKDKYYKPINRKSLKKFVKFINIKYLFDNLIIA